MKLVQGLALLAVAVAAIWLMQRPQSPAPLTILQLSGSHAGDYPPTVRLKAVVQVTVEGAYLMDGRCDPNGSDIAWFRVDPRLDGTPQVQALYDAARRAGPDSRLVATLRVRPVYRVRMQPPGTGLKPARFVGVSVIGIESWAYESRPDAATAWRCVRADRPPPASAQGQR